jgi:tRNA1(Val) A37 N6-methylase TrmN6
MLRCETLPNGRHVWVDEGCAFGTDALLLAAFAEVKPSERVCDLGTGCGILPLLWDATTDGVECCPETAALARRSIEENGLSHRIRIVEQRWEAADLPLGAYDRVVSNPPYFASGSGAVGEDPRRRLARHETENTLPSLVRVAAGLLKNGGHFVCCHRPQRMTDLLVALRDQGLEPKRLQLVQSGKKPPFLLLCDAVKGAKPSLTVLPAMVWEKE